MRGHHEYAVEIRTFFGEGFDKVWQEWTKDYAKVTALVARITGERGQFRDRGDGHGPNARLVTRFVEDHHPLDGTVPHNHMTRDIKELGQCPACDWYHQQQKEKQ